MRGGATGLEAGLYRGMGFEAASVGGVELGRAAGVFIGVGRTRRGVVCGARYGITEVLGTAGVVRGVALASADSAGETIGEGKSLGEGAGRGGRTEGEADTDGVDIAGRVACAVGATVGDAGLGVARGIGARVGNGDTEWVGVETAPGVARGVGVAETVVAGVVLGFALAGATVAVAIVLDVLNGAGFTNVLEGASGGGVTSAFIFARARSAAGRSVSAAQLFSTVA
jgi:hypothetical protein